MVAICEPGRRPTAFAASRLATNGAELGLSSILLILLNDGHNELSAMEFRKGAKCGWLKMGYAGNMLGVRIRRPELGDDEAMQNSVKLSWPLGIRF